MATTSFPDQVMKSLFYRPRRYVDRVEYPEGHWLYKVYAARNPHPMTAQSLPLRLHLVSPR